MLDEAGVDYLPIWGVGRINCIQLFNGLTDCVGINQIAQFASQAKARRNQEQTKMIK